MRIGPILVAVSFSVLWTLAPGDARATTTEAPAPGAASQDAGAAAEVDGAALYAAKCAQCHGRTGRGAGSFPRLSGRKADYLSARLEKYRAGERVGANSALMAPIARDLTDEQIAALAGFMSETFK